MTAASGVWLQHLLPKNLLSSVVYRIARSRQPWIKDPLIGWFARTYRIDLAEAELQDLRAYPSLNAFFTRALKAGARPIAGDERTVVSPADGTLSEFGTITGGRLLQAKGRRYELAELLGEEAAALTHFADGAFLTIYLAPPNYHRVHTPTAGALTRTSYIPGERFSVSRATAAAIDRLFARNERAICRFDTAAGEMALVLVGALNVSSISTANLGEIASGPRRDWREGKPLPFARGAELARFNLGSTVVLAYPRGAVDWDPRLTVGMPVRMGEALGRLRGSGQLTGGP